MRHNFNIIFLTFFTLNVYAQNLVRNPSFENIGAADSEDINLMTGNSNFKFHLKNWYSVNTSTPDLFAFNESMYTYAKDKRLKPNKPLNGNLAVGLIVYGNSHFTRNYREYIQVELKEPLKINASYYVAFYATRFFLNDNGYINNLGYVFTEEKFQIKNESYLQNISPNYSHSEIIDNAVEDWQCIESTFKADKAYKYLTIGNFHPNNQTQTKDLNGTKYNDQILYLIDFVQVVNVKDTLNNTKDNVREDKSANAAVEKTNSKTPAIKINSNLKIAKPEVLQNTISKTEPIYIHFDSDKHKYQVEEEAKLDSILLLLSSNKIEKLLIVGFTDSDGAYTYNVNLSEKRSNACKSYFTVNGIAEDRIYCKFKSESNPIASNLTQEGKRLNRRVEIILF